MDERIGRYAAFLSYSHKDAAAGRWLHRRLESYRVPRRLVGTQGERGPVPARLTPIFRDREELPAAGDLSTRVRAALAVSDSLVILCSPAAAASQWVAKEIDLFRTLHPDRPIIAAILDGEPADCFPSALCAGGIEPLAADLRPGRDGRRLGLLKLVAGLSGLGLDALVQRDAQRRLRRVTAVTGVALAAVVAMAVLTAVALQARAEAQRQRAEAEGLVEFMLTDLRDRLKGVGRLDVLTAVNQRALQHYRQQDLRRLEPTSLQRRARILHAVAEDDEKLGRIDRLSLDASEAARTTAALLSEQPGDPDRIFNHAQSIYWIGRSHELKSEWLSALSGYQQYAKAARRLVAAAPENPRYAAEVGYSYVDLGQVKLHGLRKPAAAQLEFASGILWFDRALKLRPHDEHLVLELANAYAWLADSLLAQNGKEQAALEARAKQVELLSGVQAANPSNMELLYRVALADRAVSVLLARLGRTSEARKRLTDALAALSLLANQDESNVDWLVQKAVAECEMLFRHYSRSLPAVKQLRAALQVDVARLSQIKDPRARGPQKCQAALPN